MAGNQRTRRLTEPSAPGQRTLDPLPPASPVPEEQPIVSEPLEVLEPPPAQAASATLEERQMRWLRRREAASARVQSASAGSTSSAENAAEDQKE